MWEFIKKFIYVDISYFHTHTPSNSYGGTIILKIYELYMETRKTKYSSIKHTPYNLSHMCIYIL